MKNDFVLLRISNRGTNVFTSDNATYSVNLPVEIIKPGTKKKITILDGTISIDYHSIARASAELGVFTNIPIYGYDSEVEGSHRPKSMNTLFKVSKQSGFSVLVATDSENTLSLSQDNQHSFITYNLPEQLEFTRYKVFRGVSSPLPIEQHSNPLVDTNYISFVLKIEYLDEDCDCH